ncbi:MAG TPA: arylsulfotransferase family protein [Polyangiaceae bacterium]
MRFPERVLHALAVAAIAGGCTESGTALNVAPTLSSLAVEPLELVPAFSPDVHDYVVRCGPGGSSVSVVTEAPPGVVATVRPLDAPTAVRTTGVSMNVEEDQPIIVDVSSSAGNDAYWVRCLPHDFPWLTVQTHPEAGTRAPGWYVLGNATPARNETGFVMVLDSRGTPVWYRRVATGGALSTDVLADGVIAYVPALGYYGTDPSARYVLQQLSPWQSRTISAVDAPIDEHELRILPNGDVLVFAYEQLPGVDLQGLQSFGSDETIADCTVQEIDPQGKLVWRWRASDHVDPARESTGPEADPMGATTVVDVFHFNSIDVDAHGNLLLSSRNTSAVYYVERPGGRVLWKLGGAPYSKDGAQIIRVVGDPEGGFGSQHDARFQAEGHVSMFDDHTGLAGAARGIEYAIDFGAGTARVAWSYIGPGNAGALGSFRRYPDGSSVIAWGLPSDPTRFAGAFTEVDGAGHDLMDVTFQQGDSTYRAFKVPQPTLDISVLRATAGRP